jgi:hypothetical protein
MHWQQAPSAAAAVVELEVAACLLEEAVAVDCISTRIAP